MLRITKYADRLADELDEVDFPKSVMAAQRNWIGKSKGARVKFKIQGEGFEGDEIEVFTTRSDTLWGATFMVLAPEHPLVEKLDKKEVREYVEKAETKSELERAELSKEKTGVDTGLTAINPVNGKEIPVWVSDFVLISYGTGAIMSVPAHDQRDWEFAKKFGLEVVPVVKPEKEWDFSKGALANTDEGEMINSDFINGMVPEEAIKKTIGWLEEKGLGKETVSYHLRDWIFSRQHYWGEPIPMVNCGKCGWVPVPEDELPITLPDIEKYQPTGTGESPLAEVKEWVETKCPTCGGGARRETDTMPNWAGSSWYFLRYIDSKNNEKLGDMDKLKEWMPVDVYFGGDEHTTLHLLYSRFWHKFLNDIGVVPGKEPYQKRVVHGVILGSDGQRMSKSRERYAVAPDRIWEQYGVDATRTYLMFIGPYDGVMAWDENALRGVKRFLDRFEKLIGSGKLLDVSSQEVKVIVNKTVKKVTEDIDGYSFNTGVAAMMKMVNELEKMKDGLGKKEMEMLVRVLAPYAPILTEELWKKLENKNSVHQTEWPEWEEKYLVSEKIEIPVSVNGKVRGRIEIESDKVENQKEVLKMAKDNEMVKKWTEKKEVLKEIYVPGKMVSLVVK